jgi:hypothetical protein
MHGGHGVVTPVIDWLSKGDLISLSIIHGNDISISSDSNSC